MLISHTTQIIDRDQIQMKKNISDSISFTFKKEKKRKKNTDLVLASVKVYI